jgi:hypothetical protein
MRQEPYLAKPEDDHSTNIRHLNIVAQYATLADKVLTDRSNDFAFTTFRYVIFALIG